MYEIEKLVNLLKSPLITPMSLVQNAKLDNYNEVSFKTLEGKLICDMDCNVGNDRMLFRYYFDKNDFLQEIKRIDNDKNELIYSREAELDSEIEKLKQLTSNRSIA